MTDLSDGAGPQRRCAQGQATVVNMRDCLSRVRWLLMASIALGSSCANKEAEAEAESAPVVSDFERGTAADVRMRACKHYNLPALSASNSLGPLLAQFPEAYGPGVDCVLTARDCEEVIACEDSAFARPAIDELPACEESRCEGDVLKRCTTRDDVSFHEVSYDCTLAGATCAEGENAGMAWVECVAAQQLCDGAGSYCAGTVAVVCREDGSTGLINPAKYDCANAFGSTCAESSEGQVDCEGPAVGEAQCGDGLDNDEDGAKDCDDSDCAGWCP
jgi:hypothetical protein